MDIGKPGQTKPRHSRSHEWSTTKLRNVLGKENTKIDRMVVGLTIPVGRKLLFEVFHRISSVIAIVFVVGDKKTK